MGRRGKKSVTTSRGRRKPALLSLSEKAGFIGGTLKEQAKALGISERQYRRYRNEGKLPSRKTADRIEKHFARRNRGKRRIKARISKYVRCTEVMNQVPEGVSREEWYKYLPDATPAEGENVSVFISDGRYVQYSRRIVAHTAKGLEHSWGAFIGTYGTVESFENAAKGKGTPKKYRKGEKVKTFVGVRRCRNRNSV
jgi:hypothetical protein